MKEDLKEILLKNDKKSGGCQTNHMNEQELEEFIESADQGVFQAIEEGIFWNNLDKASTLTDVYNAIYRLEKQLQLSYGETEDRANRLGVIKAVKETWITFHAFVKNN